jgi:DDE superfamily endonuclease
MEDVLDLYEEPYDPQYPTVCLDEKPVVLHRETRPTQPAAPGQPERRDYEYVREGTANLFVLVEPLAGWRHVAATEHLTKRDFAEMVRWLVEERYPEIEYVRIVLDNLNPHGPAALYEALPAEQARAIAARVEWHHTPKHGSWLNMAEIEISVFERGCLSRPVGDLATLERRVTALERERNEAHSTIHWQFTSQHARTKLADLYPVIQSKVD